MFNDLKQFIDREMRMSQVYQPVMLEVRLCNGGKATVQEIAQAILDRDPTQIEYYSEVVKRMVGKVLTNNHGITRKVGQTYELIGMDQFDEAEVELLPALCQSKIDAFEDQRCDAV